MSNTPAQRVEAIGDVLRDALARELVENGKVGTEIADEVHRLLRRLAAVLKVAVQLAHHAREGHPHPVHLVDGVKDVRRGESNCEQDSRAM